MSLSKSNFDTFGNEMKFKKIRYNLLIIGLISLICCYMGMTIFMAQPSSTDGGSADSNIEVEGGDNEQLPTDPSMEETPMEGVKIPTKKD